MMNRATVTVFLTILLAAIGTARVSAQTCAGLYQTAGATVTAYDNYNLQVGYPGPALKAAVLAFLLQSNRFFTYFTFDDSAISQCDSDTRIVTYKAAAETVIFKTRTRSVTDRSFLNAGTFFLHRMMLVMQKAGRQDGELAQLTESLKRAYENAHLSMPPELLEVDAYVNH